MNAPVSIRCAVCEKARMTPSERWFHVTENSWTDRLKVLQFDESLASRTGVYNVCCALHVRELVVHWMTTGRLDLPFARAPRSGEVVFGRSRLFCRRTPEIQTRDHAALKGASVSTALCLGELAVHRESMTRILRKNPQALGPVLETLVQALDSPVERRMVEPAMDAGARVQEQILI